MTLFRFTKNAILPMQQATFAQLGINERSDLQRLLRDNLEVVSKAVGLDLLLLSEEFGDWEDSKRRIDLLALDRNGNLVVIELKRTEDGGHMELQALRYAAMISSMTFDQAVEMLDAYLRRRDAQHRNARSEILDFLGWTEPNEESFANDVLIVLCSADFSKELTTTVLWLRDYGIEVRCVRMRPYGSGDDIFLDVQQIVPLPEAEDFQVRVREKNQHERQARSTSKDLTRFNVTFSGKTLECLPKRKAALCVIRALLELGIAPAKINSTANRQFTLVELPGKLSSDQVQAEINRLGSYGQIIRWFTNDSELIYKDSSTYVVSNQWGRETEVTLKQLIALARPGEIVLEVWS